jgi:hypothetical protein
MSAAFCGLAACASLLVIDAWGAQARAQRSVSQQIRIVARVKAFCRMGHLAHPGLLIEGRTDTGADVHHRSGGGHFNIVCNTP